MSYTKSRASALIGALFILTLTTILAVSLMTLSRDSVYHTQTMVDSETVRAELRRPIYWAMETLATPYRDLDETADKRDKLPTTYEATLADGSQVKATLSDAEALYNVNNFFFSAREYFSLYRLMRAAIPELETRERFRLVGMISRWIRRAARSQNMTGDKPYLAPHHPLGDISELRLVPGMTPEIYEKLSPNIIALPEQTKININSANALVLQSLGYRFNERMADKIIKTRTEREGFTDLNQVKALFRFKPRHMDSLTLTSNYFLVDITLEKEEISYRVLLKRTLEKQSMTFTIVSAHRR